MKDAILIKCEVVFRDRTAGSDWPDGVLGDFSVA